MKPNARDVKSTIPSFFLFLSLRLIYPAGISKVVRQRITEVKRMKAAICIFKRGKEKEKNRNPLRVQHQIWILGTTQWSTSIVIKPASSSTEPSEHFSLLFLKM